MYPCRGIHATVHLWKSDFGSWFSSFHCVGPRVRTLRSSGWWPVPSLDKPSLWPPMFHLVMWQNDLELLIFFEHSVYFFWDKISVSQTGLNLQCVRVTLNFCSFHRYLHQALGLWPVPSRPIYAVLETGARAFFVWSKYFINWAIASAQTTSFWHFTFNE